MNGHAQLPKSEQVRAFLAACRVGRCRVSVCVGGDGVCVPYDQHVGPPYRGPGDYVGHVLRIDQDTFTIGGWSFNTVVRFADVRGIWARHNAPNPCICGTSYPDEDEREGTGGVLAAASSTQEVPNGD